MLTVFAGIAEFERALINERTGAGRAAARARGVRFGRPPKLSAEQVVVARRLIDEGTAVRETARILNVHAATLYRALGTPATGRATSPWRGPADEPMGDRYLGRERFPDALSAMEIEHFFTLGEDEFAIVRRRRRVLNRLALALQIGFLKMTGTTLNSVEIIPPGILEHLGRQLGCAPPRLASIRALYRRRHTLFDHRAAALAALGRTEPSEHAERGLVAFLRHEAAAVFDNAELMACSRSWLVDHGYLLARERDIHRLARRVATTSGRCSELLSVLRGPTGKRGCRAFWRQSRMAGSAISNGLAPCPGQRAVEPCSSDRKGRLSEGIGRRQAHAFRAAARGLKHFARRMTSRKATALTRIKDPHRTIEIACFLRLRLLQLTDASLSLADHQIAAQRRGARERVAEVQASRLRRLHRLLGDLATLADDEDLDAAALRSRLRDLSAPFEEERQSTRVAEIRRELGHKSQELVRLLKTMRAAELTMPAEHLLPRPDAGTQGRIARPLRPHLPAPHRLCHPRPPARPASRQQGGIAGGARPPRHPAPHQQRRKRHPLPSHPTQAERPHPP